MKLLAATRCNLTARAHKSVKHSPTMILSPIVPIVDKLLSKKAEALLSHLFLATRQGSIPA